MNKNKDKDYIVYGSTVMIESMTLMMNFISTEGFTSSTILMKVSNSFIRT